MGNPGSLETLNRTLQTILVDLSNEDFDFISLVNLGTGTMKVLQRKNAEEVPYLLKDDATYLDNLSLFLERSVAKEVKAEAVEKMSLSKVNEELARYHTYSVTLPITLPRGETLYKKWRLTPYLQDPSFAIFTRSDVTASVMDEYDPLTGLLTSASFFYVIKKPTSFAAKKPFYVFFIDIDDFKSHNQVFGLQKGMIFFAFLLPAFSTSL